MYGHNPHRIAPLVSNERFRFLLFLVYHALKPRCEVSQRSARLRIVLTDQPHQASNVSVLLHAFGLRQYDFCEAGRAKKLLEYSGRGPLTEGEQAVTHRQELRSLSASALS